MFLNKRLFLYRLTKKLSLFFLLGMIIYAFFKADLSAILKCLTIVYCLSKKQSLEKGPEVSGSLPKPQGTPEAEPNKSLSLEEGVSQISTPLSQIGINEITPEASTSVGSAVSEALGDDINHLPYIGLRSSRRYNASQLPIQFPTQVHDEAIMGAAKSLKPFSSLKITLPQTEEPSSSQIDKVSGSPIAETLPRDIVDDLGDLGGAISIAGACPTVGAAAGKAFDQLGHALERAGLSPKERGH
jgi:hypothetical protein